MNSKIKQLTNEIDRLLGGELKYNYQNEIYGLIRFRDKDLFKEINDEIERGEIDAPITLEDVMRAIEKVKPKLKVDDGDSVDYGREFDITNETKIEVLSYWQLGKPLSSQSPEVVEKIAEILKNNDI